MMTVLRTKPSFHNSSGTLSLRSTSAALPATGASRSRILASPMRGSLNAPWLGGEQEIVNLLLEPAGTAIVIGDLVDVDHLGLDPAGMRRQQQDAVADADRFRNRVGYEQYGEFGLAPELE